MSDLVSEYRRAFIESIRLFAVAEYARKGGWMGMGNTGRESDYRVVSRASNQRRKEIEPFSWLYREMHARKDRCQPGGIRHDRSKVLPHSSARFVAKSARSYVPVLLSASIDPDTTVRDRNSQSIRLLSALSVRSRLST